MQRPDRLVLLPMHMLHSFYVNGVDVRGTGNLGASNDAAGKCLAPATSRAGTRVFSLPVPESERILRKGVRDLHTEACILDVAVYVAGNRGGWGSRLFVHRLTYVACGRCFRKPSLAGGESAAHRLLGFDLGSQSPGEMCSDRAARWERLWYQSPTSLGLS